MSELDKSEEETSADFSGKKAVYSFYSTILTALTCPAAKTRPIASQQFFNHGIPATAFGVAARKIPPMLRQEGMDLWMVHAHTSMLWLIVGFCSLKALRACGDLLHFWVENLGTNDPVGNAAISPKSGPGLVESNPEAVTEETKSRPAIEQLKEDIRPTTTDQQLAAFDGDHCPLKGPRNPKRASQTITRKTTRNKGLPKD